ncbi:MAG: S1C family serine protease [Rubripirellula sp.]
MKTGKMKFIAGAGSLKMRVIAGQTCSWFLLLSFYALLPRVGAEEGEIALDPILLEAESQRISAIQRATPSAVSVFVPGGGGGGSGVLISPDGFALTNFHVSSPAGTFMRCGLSDGKIYDAVIVGIDPVGDLAMIKLLGRDDFPYAELGDSRVAQVGDWCMVIGNPFLLASNLQPTVTWGILSGVGRYQYPSGTLLEYGDCLQTDASINPGNSGGPLYDSEGKLLGIVGRASFEKRGRVNVGVGYAISIQQAKNFLGSLRSGRVVDHATLGATVATDPDGGARVSNVLESSDAYRRGLRYGAEILEIDGRTVSTANEVQKVLATLPSGWRVKIRYRLNGETSETLVRLRSVHQEDELLEKMAAALPPPPPRPQAPRQEEPGDTDPNSPEAPDVPGGLKRLQDAENEGEQAPRLPKLRVSDKKIPQQVADQLIERKGYANYYFNQEQQQILFNALKGQVPLQDVTSRSSWTLSGVKDNITSDPFECIISNEGLQWKQGEDSVELKDRSELYDWINERSPLGLLAALDGFRRFLEQGPKKFGETFYLGAMPLAGDRPLRNCLVGNDGELEIRWLTHPVTHRLEVMEVFADRDLEPLEVWFQYEDETDDRPLMPVGIDLRYGTESILKLKLEKWESEVQKSATYSWLGSDAFVLNGRLKSTSRFSINSSGYRGGGR